MDHLGIEEKVKVEAFDLMGNSLGRFESIALAAKATLSTKYTARTKVSYILKGGQKKTLSKKLGIWVTFKKIR
jgi:hypothetical protein